LTVLTEANIRAIKDQKIAVGQVENPACERLRALAAAVPAEQAICEVGAFRGRSTGWLALGAAEGNGAHVYSIDTWGARPADSWPQDYYDSRTVTDRYSLSETRRAYERHLDECGIRDRVTPIQGYAVDVATDWDKPVGLLWHDAGHDYKSVREDLEAWLLHVVRGGVLVCHDAGNPEFGVLRAATDVLAGDPAWDWAGRELQRWPKKPDRRGILIVRKSAA
jgi:predicted O-methyltransferase YrrM